MSQLNLGRNSDNLNLIESDEENKKKNDNKYRNRAIIGFAAGLVALAVSAIGVIQFLRKSSPEKESPSPQTQQPESSLGQGVSKDPSANPGQVKPSPTQPRWQRPSGIAGYMDDLEHPEFSGS